MPASPTDQEPSHCGVCGSTLRSKGTASLCPNCIASVLFDAPDVDEAEFGGESIGAFDLLEKRGEGSFGVVYHALQTDPVRREVALKVLKPGMDSDQVIARFEAERQALALMSHPDISSVYAAGQTDDGRPYFAMELVDGEPLTDFCKRHGVDLRTRLALFVRVCGAIEHAHQKGIIHRDLKPSNILVAGSAESPEPKVIDFGIAKATGLALTDGTLLTGGAQLLGTPEYMSPEQATLGTTEIDTRADVYALGMVLYELLAGSPAWSRETLGDRPYDEFLRTVREEEPHAPSRRDPKVPADLDWVVLKAIEKDRNRRYGSAAALADDVSRFLLHDPVRARPPSTAYRMRKFVRKHRAGVAFATILLAVLSAGAVIAGMLAIKADRERKISDDLRTQARRDFSLADLRIANEISTTGRHADAIAHLCRALRNDPDNHAAAQKLVHDLTYRGFPMEAAPPAQTDGGWEGAAWVQPGRLATLSKSGKTQLWNSAPHSSPLPLTLPESDAILGGGDSPIFALRTVAPERWTVLNADGRPLSHVEGEFKNMILNADGTRLVGVDKGALTGFDTANGEMVWQYPTGSECTALAVAHTGGSIAAGFEDGSILLLFADGEIAARHQLEGGARVRHLATARGTIIAASDSGAASLWRRKTESPHQDRRRHGHRIPILVTRREARRGRCGRRGHHRAPRIQIRLPSVRHAPLAALRPGFIDALRLH